VLIRKATTSEDIRRRLFGLQEKQRLLTNSELSKPYKTGPCLCNRKEEEKAFAVGHIALAYLLGKSSARLLKTKIYIPLILALSVIPDIDILFYPVIEHRGPIHSIVVILAVFLPFFFVYRKAAVPYCIAVIQHSLVGDFLAGGRIRLFWPITSQYFGTNISIRSPTNVANEWMFFLIASAVMIAAKDIHRLLRPAKTSLILAIPTFTVLLPTVLEYPLNVPLWLMPPHVFYLILFLTAIVATLLDREFH
jgi:hypothetical protein